MGNVFTHYNYTTTDIIKTTKNFETEIKSQRSDFTVKIRESDEAVSLPEDSPFRDWKTARRFAGPLPFTFTYHENTHEVLIIEGVRENWIPVPVNVIHHKVSFINALGLKGLVLANAFLIKNIPYQWKKGRVEIWKK